MENLGIFLRKMIEIVGAADTIIFNFQLSIFNLVTNRKLRGRMLCLHTRC